MTLHNLIPRIHAISTMDVVSLHLILNKLILPNTILYGLYKTIGLADISKILAFCIRNATAIFKNKKIYPILFIYIIVFEVRFGGIATKIDKGEQMRRFINNLTTPFISVYLPSTFSLLNLYKVKGKQIIESIWWWDIMTSHSLTYSPLSPKGTLTTFNLYFLFNKLILPNMIFCKIERMIKLSEVLDNLGLEVRNPLPFTEVFKNSDFFRVYKEDLELGSILD